MVDKIRTSDQQQLEILTEIRDIAKPLSLVCSLPSWSLFLLGYKVVLSLRCHIVTSIDQGTAEVPKTPQAIWLPPQSCAMQRSRM
jgi:hypothetical protein